jgi:hypothetical protein
MPDEIATEKRARYDDRTNKVVGICRQHGWKLPLDLRTGDDLNVLCKEVKDGNGHLAGEVRSFFFQDISCHLHTPAVLNLSHRCIRSEIMRCTWFVKRTSRKSVPLNGAIFLWRDGDICRRWVQMKSLMNLKK